jgi:uncharacterized SAM-binding protein YcdF (DUF218 family)
MTKIKPIPIFSFLVAMTALLFLLIIGLISAGKFLVTAHYADHADAVIVLSGGDIQRLQEAAKLYKSGYAPIIVITEIENLKPEQASSSSNLKIQQLGDLGVPANAVILTEKSADSTFQEAKAVRALMEKQGWSYGVVVTDPYHTRRSSIIFNDVLRGSKLLIGIRPAEESWYHATTWWLSTKGWQATTSEYIKLVSYELGIQRQNTSESP